MDQRGRFRNSMRSGRLRSKRTFLPAAYLLVVFILSVVLAGCSATTKPGPSGKQGTGKITWEVYFSPEGGATDAVVRALDNAKRSVLVQAYSFTSAPIAKALVNAHRRGVKVLVILDKSNRTQRYSSAEFLLRMGVPTWIDSEHAIAHNKVMVIDDEEVITGSFNFTKAAETRNAENLLVIHDPNLAERYAHNWKIHLDHSERYTGRVP